MKKLTRDFFNGNEVLFVGYSSRNSAFSQSIHKAFTSNGFKVYPLNTKQNASYDIKVYNNMTELPKVPDCAFILLNRDNAAKAVEQLANGGVKRVVFQNAKNADAELLEKCSKLGLETAVGCPMMLFGKGLHKVHAFFAGVK